MKNKLENLGNRVFVPQFPVPKVVTPGGHKLDEWFKTFYPYQKYVNKNTIIIAHSRGCVFCYHLLPTFKDKVRATFLVGPWLNYIWYKGPSGDSFHSRPFEWKKIKEKSKYIEIFQSTNDETPVSEGKQIAEMLNANITIVKNAGHFNIATYKRFNRFPLLLEHIKKHL